MADVYIREYTSVAQDKHGHIPAPLEPGNVVNGTVTNPTSATPYTPSKDTKYIMMTSTTAFHYLVGSSPTATTSHFRVPADVVLFIGIADGNTLSFINAS